MTNLDVIRLTMWLSKMVMVTAQDCGLQYHRIGCYQDDQKSPRPLPKLLFSDRVGPEKHIDWENWDEYIKKTVCRCAKHAAQNNFAYFGLQFYGECWSGDGASTFARAGRSQHCITKGFDKCKASSETCVGESHANFVYMLTNQDSRCQTGYQKVGCYNNNQGEPFGYPIMLFTDNQPSSDKFSNVTTGFSFWGSYVLDLACRCAAIAKERNFFYFSLQNFGECWGGHGHVGGLLSNDCVGQDIRRSCCTQDSVCVGQGREKPSNYVFRIM